MHSSNGLTISVCTCVSASNLEDGRWVWDTYWQVPFLCRSLHDRTTYRILLSTRPSRPTVHPVSKQQGSRGPEGGHSLRFYMYLQPPVFETRCRRPSPVKRKISELSRSRCNPTRGSSPNMVEPRLLLFISFRCPGTRTNRRPRCGPPLFLEMFLVLLPLNVYSINPC